MPETDTQSVKRFYEDVPADKQGFFLRGGAGYDWGMKNRLARLFRPSTGRTVMLAIDHGYFQGPTSGLERADLTIVPILPGADAVMLTRGMLRSTVPATLGAGIVLRASGGPSILRDLSDERVAVDMDDAVRVNAHAVAVQVFIGADHETQSVENMTRLVDAGYRVGVPVIGVTAVGKDLARDERYLGLATRICGELGAHVVKTYYCERGFERVTAGCPVPVIMAGGKKVPELDALTMAYRALQEGAAGVDMGRNIFQAASPRAMLKAINMTVHEGLKPDEAIEVYRDAKELRASAP